MTPPPETPPPPATATPPAEPTAAPAPKPPLAELKREAVKSLIAAFNAHDARKIASLYTPDARTAGASPAGWTEESGRAGVEDMNGQMFTAFPDLRTATPRVYLSGDVAIQEWEMTGTNRGDYGAVKATNKPIGVHGASVYWFDQSGLITRDNTYSDTASISKQIGATRGKTRPIPQLAEGEPMFVVSTGLPEENRWIARAQAYYGTFDRRDESGFTAALAKDVTEIDYTEPADLAGAAAVRDRFRALVHAFPDLQVQVRNLWGFGDRVVAEVTLTGTQTGAYAGVKASNKPVALHDLEVLRFDENGKVIDITRYGSSLELTAAAEAGTLSSRKQAPENAAPTPTPPSPGYHMSPGGNPYPGPTPGPTPKL